MLSPSAAAGDGRQDSFVEDAMYFGSRTQKIRAGSELKASTLRMVFTVLKVRCKLVNKRGNESTVLSVCDTDEHNNDQHGKISPKLQ